MPLHGDDPLVAPQPLGELSTAHVQGVDAARPAPQEHVGEAAGRRPDVDGDQARGIDPEGIERGEQLVRAPADLLAAGVDAERLGDIDEIARLPVGAR